MSSENKFEIFIIHHSKLKERKVFLEKNLTSNYKTSWVTEKEFEEPPRRLEGYWKPLGLSLRKAGFHLGINSRSLTRSRKQAHWEAWLLFLASFVHNRGDTLVTSGLPEKIALPRSWLELQAMHYTALRQAIENENDWTLILEDDAVPTDCWLDVTQRIMSSLNKNPVWVNLNSGANLLRTSSDPTPDQNGLFQVKPSATRCTTAYLVNKQSLRILNETFQTYGMPEWLPIDLVFHLALVKQKIPSFWQEPVVFSQGSETGMFRSGFR